MFVKPGFPSYYSSHTYICQSSGSACVKLCQRIAGTQRLKFGNSGVFSLWQHLLFGAQLASEPLHFNSKKQLLSVTLALSGQRPGRSDTVDKEESVAEGWFSIVSRQCKKWQISNSPAHWDLRVHSVPFWVQFFRTVMQVVPGPQKARLQGIRSTIQKVCSL